MLPLLSFSQEFDDSFRGSGGIRAMFYNCENLFDTQHDSSKLDNDFSPTGMYGWTNYKYFEKLRRISKVITSVGGWEAPEIIGLAEVENAHVLINLIKNTGLKSHDYRFIHYESPDVRGIDVALLYRPEKFSVFSSRPIVVTFPFDTMSKTRDILYVKGVVLEEDTLHIFINHFPSRLGGEAASEPKRIYAASILKTITDSILNAVPCAKILIMGDFNDNPTNESIQTALKAQSFDNHKDSGLINLMNTKSRDFKTHFYRGVTGVEWSCIDQIMVSSAFFSCNGLNYKNIEVFKGDFLFEEDDMGNKIPKRSFIGMKNNEGFSDHLPVFVDLFFKE
jgi:predicted extracellular nuclease